jgi:hypothetical protein
MYVGITLDINKEFGNLNVFRILPAAYLYDAVGRNQQSAVKKLLTTLDMIV